MIKYKQKQSWGCGVYSVANALNLNNFVTEDRIDKSKNGNNIGQLSNWLQEDGHQIYIDVLYFSAMANKLPEIEFGYKPVGDGLNFLPILIQVRFSEEGKQHLMAGRISQSGKLFVMDSLKDEVVETTIANLNDMYHAVYGLYVFNSLDASGYVFIVLN